MEKKYKVLDVFSGAGGMSEGFLQAGFDIPCATDYSIEAAGTYINRHKQLGFDVNYFNGDIRDLTNNKKKFRDLIGDNFIDVIVGGPPCQGFSLSCPQPPSMSDVLPVALTWQLTNGHPHCHWHL